VDARTTVLVDGLSFPESPRWHDGRLYVSDMGTARVVAVDPDSGSVTAVLPRVPGAPSGLAWDGEGRLLVVSMVRSIVYRDDGGDRLTPWADLSALGGGWRNDCVRHASGLLYVGAVGGEDHMADIVVIDDDGSTRVAASGVDSPNGMVLSEDGSTLVVSEHLAGRFTAFDVLPDGTLAHPRPWAAGDGWLPDGICLDAEGAIWMASAGDPVVRRVGEGREVVETVSASQPAYACMLGGVDRRTLFVCTAPGSSEDDRVAMRGRVETVRVDVPGAGRP
jgi:sugar lactone lactonase YvrE